MRTVSPSRWASMAVWALLLRVVVADAASPPGRIELVRDAWGTPHIFADSDAGAMYGLGYATAEDRGFQMYYSLRIIQGRLAEVIGDQRMQGRQNTAVENDRKMRTFGFYRAAKEVAGRLDADSLAMLQAYSEGVNDCFAANRDKLHYLFDQLGLAPEPWTPADCIASWWHLGQFFATDGTRELIVYRNNLGGAAPAGRGQRAPAGRRGGSLPAQANLAPLPPDDAAAVIQREDVSDDWLDQTRTFMRQYGPASTQASFPEGPKFSHAWVVGGSRTTTGSAVLVSDPQTPVRNPSLFYEFHIQGKTFDARGIGVPGSPIILIGWNPQVAWGVTALGADQADLFRLRTDAEHPDQYFYDGQWRPMTVIDETVRVKGGREQRLRIRLTHLGPVATEFCFAQAGDPQVSLKRIPICENDRETIQGALAMLRARSAGEFLSALGGWRFPSMNAVFGDKEGNIGFSLAGALPIRAPRETQAGNAAMDGTSSASDWRTFVPSDLLPHAMNPARGYLLSANHRAIGSFYPIPLGASTGWLGDTERSWRLRERLEGKEKFAPEDVLDVHYDSVNASRREIVRIGLHLRDVLKRELSPEAQRALEQLGPWHEAGASSDLTKPGAALACEIPTFFRIMTTDLAQVYGGGQTGLCYFLKTVEKRLKADPKADITPLEQAFVDSALASAWENAVQRYGGEPSRWMAEARRQVTMRRLGYFESLDGFGSLDATKDLTFPQLSVVDGGTIRSQAAQSYTQFVPLHDVDGAMSILPIGSSERPDSPARMSTMELWRKGELHPAPISRAAVEKIAASRKILSGRQGG